MYKKNKKTSDKWKEKSLKSKRIERNSEAERGRSMSRDGSITREDEEKCSPEHQKIRKKKKCREDERKKRILKCPRTKDCQNSRLILKWSFKIKTKRQNKNANRIRQKKVTSQAIDKSTCTEQNGLEKKTSTKFSVHFSFYVFKRELFLR